MKVTLMAYTHSDTLSPADVAGEAAAICTNYPDREKALRGALNAGHESVIEHASFTFLIEDVSRVLLAQMTRHRIASFSVQSQRYCGANLDVVIPPSMYDEYLLPKILAVRNAVEDLYRTAKHRGKPDEDIRYFTLQGGMTKKIVTMNARELHHFFALRCCNRAQWEIRELADKMLEECKRVAPELFEKAGCACMIGKPCPEGKRSCGKPRVAV